MRNSAFLAVGLLTVMVAACGSSEPAPVIQQIVIREPGAAVADAAPAGESEPVLDKVALGQDAFQACAGCHNAEEGGPNMAGPNLHGVFGRKAGSVEGYDYSDALAGSDITWDYATLDRFLANPSGYLPGTDMVAGGVRDGERRAAVVAYLVSTTPAPAE